MCDVRGSNQLVHMGKPWADFIPWHRPNCYDSGKMLTYCRKRADLSTGTRPVLYGRRMFP